MNSHAATRANYDRLSRWYDLFAGSEKRFTEAGLLALAPKPGERILEIGCGTGHALRWMLDTQVRATGLDLSAGMLSRAQQAGLRSKKVIALCQGDALKLPFKSTSFNAIFLSFTLELFAENEFGHLLAECRRVLRWDGRMGVVALAKEKNLPVRIYEWFHARWPLVIDCRPIYVHTALIQAGFEINEAHRMVMWGLPVEIVIARLA